MHRTWTNLRLWINEQESNELRTGTPLTLTPAQRDAINTLVPGTIPQPQRSASVTQEPSAPMPVRVSGPVVDPEFDRTHDWVSSLVHIAQKRQETTEFTSESREIGHKMPIKWVFFCSLSRTDGKFPNKDYGFVNGEPPCFSTKKDAKQYASKCAVTYLRDLISPPHRPSTPTPSPSTPAARPQQQQQQTPTTTKEKEYTENSDDGVSLTPQADGADSGPSNSDSDLPTPRSARKRVRLDNGDEPDPVSQVLGLCKSMGMTPPRFEATPHKFPGYYNAKSVFPDSFPEIVPAGLGLVDEVFTKKEAKQTSASQVLEWLKEKERERNEQLMGLSSP